MYRRLGEGMDGQRPVVGQEADRWFNASVLWSCGE